MAQFPAHTEHEVMRGHSAEVQPGIGAVSIESRHGAALRFAKIGVAVRQVKRHGLVHVVGDTAIGGPSKVRLGVIGGVATPPFGTFTSFRPSTEIEATPIPAPT